jgi:4a-hydroxytetrahydrobiopterin dehydratase
MRELLTADQISAALRDLPGWKHSDDALVRVIEAPDFATAMAIVDDVARVAAAADHHPDIDIRHSTLTFRAHTWEPSGLTALDVELAKRISAIAADRGVHTDDALDTRPRIEICVDCLDPNKLLPWWSVALRYVEVGGELVDPDGAGPTVWFQQVPELKASKNRVHLDLWLPLREAAARRALLLSMGGALIAEFDRGEDEDNFWVLADPEGNEVCLCIEE